MRGHTWRVDRILGPGGGAGEFRLGGAVPGGIILHAVFSSISVARDISVGVDGA